MIDKKLSLKRTIQAPKNEVFKYFVQPHLIEKWSAPEGMTLKVPQFENKAGGKYRYEHTSKDGVFVCTGHLEELIPNQKLVMIDTIKAPDGKILAENQPTTIEFKDRQGGTEIVINQENFESEEFYQECQKGWNDCLNKLEGLLNAGEGRAQAAA